MTKTYVLVTTTDAGGVEVLAEQGGDTQVDVIDLAYLMGKYIPIEEVPEMGRAVLATIDQYLERDPDDRWLAATRDEVARQIEEAVKYEEEKA